MLFVLMREVVALVILRYSQGNTSRFEELRLGAGGRGLVLSGGGDWRETPGLVQVGALLAKAAGRIPIREVESDPVQDFGGELVWVGDERVGGETAEGAALARLGSGVR